MNGNQGVQQFGGSSWVGVQAVGPGARAEADHVEVGPVTENRIDHVEGGAAQAGTVDGGVTVPRDPA